MIYLLFLLAVVIGAVYCFVGWRIFKFIISLTGFLVGGLGAGSIAYAFSSGSWLAAIITGLVGAVAGALFMIPMYFVGIFFLGMWLGSMLGLAITAALALKSGFIVIFPLALAGGICAIILQKLMVVLSTAVGGSALMTYGVFALFGFRFDPMQIIFQPQVIKYYGFKIYIAFAVWIVFALAGISAQLKLTKSKFQKNV